MNKIIFKQIRNNYKESRKYKTNKFNLEFGNGKWDWKCVNYI